MVGGANGEHGCSFPLLGVECRCIISRGWRQTAALPAPLAAKTEIHGDAEVRQQPRLLTAVPAALPTPELTSFVSFLAYFTFLLRLPVPRLPAYRAANGSGRQELSTSPSSQRQFHDAPHCADPKLVQGRRFAVFCMEGCISVLANIWFCRIGKQKFSREFLIRKLKKGGKKKSMY